MCERIKAIPVPRQYDYFTRLFVRTGAVNEDPFENRITDVPLTATCREIERDLRSILGETELPPRLEPRDGYLF